MSAEARSRSANDNTLLSCLARPAAQARFDQSGGRVRSRNDMLGY